MRPRVAEPVFLLQNKDEGGLTNVCAAAACVEEVYLFTHISPAAQLLLCEQPDTKQRNAAVFIKSVYCRRVFAGLKKTVCNSLPVLPAVPVPAADAAL